MAEAGRCRFVLVVSFFVLVAAMPGFSQEGKSERLVRPEMLKHERGQLKILWENKFPISKSETLKHLFILGERIYGLSSRNYMVSLNRKTGDAILSFSGNLAPAGVPVTGFDLYKNGLFTIIGDKLVELNPKSIRNRMVRRLEFGPVCPAARNESYFYIAGADGRVHTLRSDNKLQVFEAAAPADSAITSIVADPNFAVFGTDAGDVISITPDRAKLLWKFKAGDAIVAPIVKAGNSLFVASKDTYVYKLNTEVGSNAVWKYRAGGIPDRGPRVTQDVVYQYVRSKGLTAISRKGGKAMWRLGEGRDLLAQWQAKAYVITNKGTLVVMDNNKAKRLYSISCPLVSRYAANTVDSKIYIADKSGLIACLEPVE